MRKNEISVRADKNGGWGFWRLVYIFFLCAAIGWIWEEIYCLIKHGFWVERGFLFGPVLPIYGLGGIAIYGLKTKVIRHSPLLLFFASFLSAGIIEYASSWLLELIFDRKWWDYAHVPWNLNGRVHFIGLLFFGALGCVLGHFVFPRFTRLIEGGNRRAMTAIAAVMLGIFTVDVIASCIFHLVT